MSSMSMNPLSQRDKVYWYGQTTARIFLSASWEPICENLKTQHQASPQSSATQLVKHSWQQFKKNGESGVFRGWAVCMAARVAKEGSRLVFLSQYTRFFNEHIPRSLNTNGGLAALFTGVAMGVSDTALLPFNRLFTWKVNQEYKGKYLGFLYEKYKQKELVSELFAGGQANLSYRILSWTIWMGANEYFRQKLEPVDMDSRIKYLAKTGLVGATVTLTSAPLDLVKTRRQMDKGLRQRSITQDLGQLYKECGVRGVFAGAGIGFVKSTGNAAFLGWMVDELMKQALEKRSK